MALKNKKNKLNGNHINDPEQIEYLESAEWEEWKTIEDLPTDDEEAITVVAEGAIWGSKGSDFGCKIELVNIKTCEFSHGKPMIPWCWHDIRYESVR